MTQSTILPLALLCISAIARAMHDTLRDHYSSTWIHAIIQRRGWHRLDNWLDPAKSWRNKYKPAPGDVVPITPRFPGSTTWMVWITDADHFTRMLYLTGIQLTLALTFQPISLPGLPAALVIAANLLLFKAINGLLFEAFYAYLLLQSSNQKSMNYQIFKWIRSTFIALPARGAGWLIVLLYLAALAALTLITWQIAPGLPQWKYPDPMTAWKWVLLAGCALWIIWFFHMFLGGWKRMEERYAREARFRPGKRK